MLWRLRTNLDVELQTWNVLWTQEHSVQLKKKIGWHTNLEASENRTMNMPSVLLFLQRSAVIHIDLWQTLTTLEIPAPWKVVPTVPLYNPFCSECSDETQQTWQHSANPSFCLFSKLAYSSGFSAGGSTHLSFNVQSKEGIYKSVPCFLPVLLQNTPV